MIQQPLTNKKAQTQDKILTVAARAIREYGYHGIGVAKLMKEAGLTHGGFYAHFPTRSHMLIKAIDRAGHESKVRLNKAIQQRELQSDSAFKALVSSYLSDAHRESIASGCPIVALGSEMGRQDQSVRDASVNLITQMQKTVAQSLPELSDSGTISVIVSTLVGTLQLARAQNAAEGQATLLSTKQFLLQQFDK